MSIPISVRAATATSSWALRSVRRHSGRPAEHPQGLGLVFRISPLGQHRHRLRPHPPERHGLHRHGRRADHALHGRAALQTRPAGGHRRKLFILLQPRQRIRIAGLLFAQNGQRRADRDDRFDPHGAAPHHLPRSGRPPPAHQPRRGQRRRSVRHLSQADGCAHRRRLPLLQRLGSPQGLLRADYRQADPLAGAFRRRHPVRGKRDPLQRAPRAS